MSFEEFQHLARLSVVGALDPEEREQFEVGLHLFGAEAEAFLKECRKLNAIFALSLRPCAPDPRTKARLFSRIRQAGREAKNGPNEAYTSNALWQSALTSETAYAGRRSAR